MVSGLVQIFATKYRFENNNIMTEVCMLHVTGVLWTGIDTVIPNAREAVKFIREKVESMVSIY